MAWMRPIALTALSLLSSVGTYAADPYVLTREIQLVDENQKTITLHPDDSDELVILEEVQVKHKPWKTALAVRIISSKRNSNKIYFTSQEFFKQGTRLHDILQPEPLQKEIKATLQPTTCCPPSTTKVPVSTLAPIGDSFNPSQVKAITSSGKSLEGCLKKLSSEYYRKFSVWKDKNLSERIDTLADIATRVEAEIKQSTPTTSSQSGDRYKDNVLNPDFLHHEVTKEAVLCLIKAEVRFTEYEPLALNYTYCNKRGRNGRPASSAQGLSQIQMRTFTDMVARGIFPESSLSSITPENRKDPKALQRAWRTEFFNNPKLQVEGAFHYLNYLAKKSYLSNSNNAASILRESIGEYDQDSQSEYTRRFAACHRCLKDPTTPWKARIQLCLD